MSKRSSKKVEPQVEENVEDTSVVEETKPLSKSEQRRISVMKSEQKKISLKARVNTQLPDGRFVKAGETVEVDQEYFNRLKKEKDRSFY